jgi:hypothetical protein
MTMSGKPIAGPHMVRYGTAADQKFLLGDFLSTYDQLVINANIVAHIPGAIASFITQRARLKPFCVDPQTHAFQHDIIHLQSKSSRKQGEIRRSLKILLEAYGEPVASRVGQALQSLLPGDFRDRRTLQGFCERVLSFQWDAVERETTKADVSKYYRYLFQSKGIRPSPSFRPSVLVAPYFYLTETTMRSWMPVNIQCARLAQSWAARVGVPLAVQVVISRGLLRDSSLIDDLARGYAGVRPSVFLIWVDSFSEHSASERELRALVQLFTRFAGIAQVVNLYGGFFSVALQRLGLGGLVGVTHGLEYGEDRGVVPVGGGIPVAKFYLPALHRRVPFRDAVRAVRALGGFRSASAFQTVVCDCRQCRHVITTNPETDFAQYGEARPVSFVRGGQPITMECPLPETKERCVAHYMWSKHREYRLSASEVLQSLSDARTLLGRVLGAEAVAHCKVWERVLSTLPGVGRNSK